MGMFLSKIKGLLTRGRVSTVCHLSLIAVLGYFAYPQLAGFFGYPEHAPANLEISPAATLQAMTDEDLRRFASNDQLPEYLRANDWVRTRIVEKTLRDRLPHELVLRWDRDLRNNPQPTPVITASNDHVLPVSAQFDPSQRGVLGVQFVARGAGLTVSYVYPSSAAARAGLHVGDEILSINGGRVASQTDLMRQLTDAANRGGHAQIEIQREYTRRFVTADVSGQSAAIMANRGSQRY